MFFRTGLGGGGGGGVLIPSLNLASFHWGLKITPTPILAMSPEEETQG